MDPQHLLKSHLDDEFAVKSLKDYEHPPILFYFDFAKREFYWYNQADGIWNWNDLTNAYSGAKDLPTVKFCQKDADIKDIKIMLSQMSCVPVSRNIIYLIGGHHPMYNCIEYNLSLNTFTGKDRMHFVRNHPCVCALGRYIYASSGDKLTSYSAAVERFDTLSNTWKIMKGLPQPQYQGTAQVTCYSMAFGTGKKSDDQKEVKDETGRNFAEDGGEEK